MKTLEIDIRKYPIIKVLDKEYEVKDRYKNGTLYHNIDELNLTDYMYILSIYERLFWIFKTDEEDFEIIK